MQNLCYLKQMKKLPIGKVIIIIRNPFDVFVSLYNYYTLSEYERSDNLDFFCKYKTLPFLKEAHFPNFQEHYESWVNSGTDCYVVKYSDLIDNFENQIKYLCDFLNLEIFLDGIQLVKIQDEKQREIKGKIESEINVVGDINIKNLESFLNQRGISLLLTGENPNLKFLGDLEVKVYGFRETISIDYSIENLKGIL